MFVGIKKNKDNERTINFLENLVIEKKPERIILFSTKSESSSRLMEDFLTALNANKLKTKIIKFEDIINDSYYYIDTQKHDLVAIDGFLNKIDLTADQEKALDLFLATHEGERIFFNCPLTPKEIFSLKGQLISESSFSRTIFGSRQLFLNEIDREEFLKMLYHFREISPDYRIKQSIDFLENKITPYQELEFISKEKIQELLSQGNDSYNTCLILTKEPQLKLIPFENLKQFDIAVRLESFAAGNGYVGKKPSNASVNEYFRTLLEGYYTFLKTGKEQYLDYLVYSSFTDLDLILEIKKEMKKINS
ncbi:hypothetical protein WKH37_15890 [Bacillus subtilis]|uniref:hypothetical protein n=1 Tax=Bacillus TaxID=1386 RepID=UPI000F53168C|nr:MULTISPECIES: hypothetical protein [Bacillus]WJD94245.1 hypothetical protein QR321_09350 [Bacillus spizizenii]MBU8677165.1 hypothetical protein [Bacillus subtilis]MEC1363514.1 hypothetical protein [Bacillus subtilis]MEC1380438.1 hypothetical protein [Bacillus subtilis]MEC1421024.1 hypothetical protein [Bacillus subtilis]